MSLFGVQKHDNKPATMAITVPREALGEMTADEYSRSVSELMYTLGATVVFNAQQAMIVGAIYDALRADPNATTFKMIILRKVPSEDVTRKVCQWEYKEVSRIIPDMYKSSRIGVTSCSPSIPQ